MCVLLLAQRLADLKPYYKRASSTLSVANNVAGIYRDSRDAFGRDNERRNVVEVFRFDSQTDSWGHSSPQMQAAQAAIAAALSASAANDNDDESLLLKPASSSSKPPTGSTPDNGGTALIDLDDVVGNNRAEES